MDAFDFIRTYQRMCLAHDSEDCKNEKGKECPLKPFTCNFIEAPIEEMNTIALKVEEWGKAHPVYTRGMKLKKAFPNVKCHNDGAPCVCPKSFLNGCCPRPLEGCNPTKCHQEYWNTEIAED